jgi:hypothetical protein
MCYMMMNSVLFLDAMTNNNLNLNRINKHQGESMKTYEDEADEDLVPDHLDDNWSTPEEIRAKQIQEQNPGSVVQNQRVDD